MKEKIEYTQEEQMELLRNDLTQLIVKYDLPIYIVYSIMQQQTNDLETLYNERRKIVQNNIYEKFLQQASSNNKEEENK